MVHEGTLRETNDMDKLNVGEVVQRPGGRNVGVTVTTVGVSLLERRELRWQKKMSG